MYLLHYTRLSADGIPRLEVPSSKSASNRGLIMRALCEVDFKIRNLSTARDTVILNKLLNIENSEYNAQDAGTTIRFLTAFLAFKTERAVVLKGTERAHDRPIGILVSALRLLGAKIEYIEKSGFPPLRIFPAALDKSSDIEIAGDVSSQFISAIMMIAPLLVGGLTLRLTPPVVSEPYIQMTLAMMAHHEIEAAYVNNIIRINPGKYVPKSYAVEADWSSAVFFYGYCLSSGVSIFISSLSLDSEQADAEIFNIMDELGVCSEQKADGVLISNSGVHPSSLKWDCSDCPDLVPGLCFGLAAKGISVQLEGISHLKHKESDRALAIKTELKKVGVQVDLSENTLTQSGQARGSNINLETHRDHRMAMSAAILSPVIPELQINDPEVVEKSFPDFWKQLQRLGLDLEGLT